MRRIIAIAVKKNFKDIFIINHLKLKNKFSSVNATLAADQVKHLQIRQFNEENE